MVTCVDFTPERPFLRLTIGFKPVTTVTFTELFGENVYVSISKLKPVKIYAVYIQIPFVDTARMLLIRETDL